MAKRSRAERLEKLRSQRKRLALGFGVAGLVTLALIALIVVVSLPPATAPAADESATDAIALAVEATAATAATSTATASLPVEVPVLTGMQIEEAIVLLKAAGLAVTRAGTPAGDM
ncbi:MAG: hypothetical protein JXP37_02020, partial [Coriobacteriia bacterium]|nr:hypothetical protein [Coriobacteriia bacterium]